MTGLLPYPNSLVGNGIGAIFPKWTDAHEPDVERQHPAERYAATFWWKPPTSAAAANTSGPTSIKTRRFPQYLSMGTQLNTLVPNPFYGKILNGSLSAATVRLGSLLVPYPQYGGINQIRALGGRFDLPRLHPAGGAVVLARPACSRRSYTAAKLIDNVNERFLGGANYINPYDLNLSQVHLRRRRFPALRRQLCVRTALRARQARSLARNRGAGFWATGRPAASSQFQTGNAALDHGACTFSRRERHGLLCDRLKNANLPSGQQSMTQWFDTTAFASPARLLLRQRFAHRTEPPRPRTDQLRFGDEPVAADPRAHAAAVPRRVVQSPESPEPGRAEHRHHLVHVTGRSRRRAAIAPSRWHCGWSSRAGCIAMTNFLDRASRRCCFMRRRFCTRPATSIRRRSTTKSCSDIRAGSPVPQDGSQRWTHWSRGVPPPETLTVDLYPGPQRTRCR